MRVEWIGSEDVLSDGGALGTVGGGWWGVGVGLVGVGFSYFKILILMIY